jgi:DNA-binding transcriptional ArsR family regulator
MFIPTKKVLKRVLLLSLAGTKGGYVRLQIIMLLQKKPSNINELAKKLSLDYKTVQHHIRVLEKSNLITSSKKRYGNAYKLSELLIAHKDILKELQHGADMGKST